MGENSPAPEIVARSGRSSTLACLLQLFIAALIAWVFLHTQHPVFEVPEKYHIVAMGAQPERAQALRKQQARVNRMNAMLEVGVLGGLLGSALAFGKPACCPVFVRLIIALPWGGLVGAGAGLLGVLVYAQRADLELPTVSDTIQVQAVLLGSLGAGLGMLVGAFARSARSAATGTVAGAVAGAVAGTAYPITAAVLMPAVSVELPVPEILGVRFLWLGLFAGCFALIVPLMVRPQPAAQSPAAPE